MHNELIEKYLDSKKRKLLLYAEDLYDIYASADDLLWTSKENYLDIFKKIFELYIYKYYLRDESELEKLNNKKYKNNEFKMAYSLAIITELYGEKYDDIKKNHKNGLYILTIILYLIINIDKEINIYTDNLTTTSIIEELDNCLKSVGQEKINEKYPFLLEKIANQIKDNIKFEKKFFKNLESTNFYNIFTKYDENSYYVKYSYDGKLFDKYNDLDVVNAFKKFDIDSQYLKASYELASVTILKEYLYGKKVHEFILPISSNFIKDENNITAIYKIFDNYFIRNKIKFSINYSDYVANELLFSVLLNMKFQIVLFMDKDNYIMDYSDIKLKFGIYAKDKFIENNPKFMNFIEQKKLKCAIVGKNDYVSEKVVIKESLI